MKKRTGLALSAPMLAFILLAAGRCGGGTPKGSADGAVGATSGCANSCERGDWPRLIVGVGPVADGGTSPLASVKAIDASMKSWEPTNGGCPSTDGFICSYSWSTGASDSAMTIVATLSSGETLTLDVPLGPFNQCAQQIAYVELARDPSPHFTQVRYLSPCSGLR